MNILPDPVLERVHNDTGLALLHYMKMAPGRQFCDVLAIKASFSLTPDGIDTQAKPGKFCMADLPRTPDEVRLSSLLQAGDTILGKPGADVYLTGHARRSRPAKRWPVSVGLAHQDKTLISYQCLAVGPRVWQHSVLSGWNPSEPEDTQSVPIQYELAYGGVKRRPQQSPDEWEVFEPNPSGSGFSFEGCSRSDTPSAPQWESSSLLANIRTPDLVGLGPVARPWASRAQYAGTYDKAWERMRQEQQPIVDYPKDFDLRFFQCAHPRLQTAEPLQGNETLRLGGLLEHTHDLITRLPGWRVWAVCHSDANPQQGAPEDKPLPARPLPLDTVHIDLDLQQVNLVWHLTLPHTMAVHTVELKSEQH
jgi:hypothetical protein